jgi:hypothetical protein
MKALVNQSYLLQKFQGKGGWTYALIPEVAQNKTNPFGWVKVRGSIDGVEISKYHLMPFGNGQLFLPVKASIRKQIKKEVGDTVWVCLYADDEPFQAPAELLECLATEEAALTFFQSLSESEQNNYVKWIYEAKKEETKATRIVKTIERLMQRKKLYEL